MCARGHTGLKHVTVQCMETCYVPGLRTRALRLVCKHGLCASASLAKVGTVASHPAWRHMMLDGELLEEVHGNIVVVHHG